MPAAEPEQGQRIEQKEEVPKQLMAAAEPWKRLAAWEEKYGPFVLACNDGGGATIAAGCC